MKSKMYRTISALSCVSMILGSIVPAYATEVSTIESNHEQIEVFYEQTSSYSVLIPKTITLDASKKSNYSITVKGDIAFDEQVRVSPVDGITDTEILDFYMKEQTSGSKKPDVIAQISQSKFIWNSEEVANSYEETNNTITAKDLTAGRWKGTFEVEISLESTGVSHQHNYTESITKEPTCKEEGVKIYTCDCGDSYTTPMPMTDHNYVDGTCTECGDKDANHKHNYIETITKEPTCTEAGEKTYTCACGDCYTEPIEAKGHNYIDGFCTDCGEKDPNHEHNYIEAIAKEPTCTEEGEKTYTCACGESYTATVEAKGHNYEDNICTDCGEVNDPYAVAPADAYHDWNYTLDDTDNTITLKCLYSMGTSSEDIIVYDSYEVNGKVYRTKIASNDSFDTMNYMFASRSNVQTVIFGNHIDFSDTASMAYMFAGCKNLRSIDLGNNFDTSYVVNMKNMFANIPLTDLDVSSLDTSNVTNMGYMFNGCPSLTSLDISNFDTGNVTDMGHMFNACSSLTSLDISNFDTSNVINMNYMFYKCSSLTNLDISNFDTCNVTNMNSMFGYCSSLTDLDVSNFDTGMATNMDSMFLGCSLLTNLDVSNFDTGKATSMFAMFGTCSSLTSLDLSNFNTSKVTNMNRMFADSSKLKTVYVSRTLWVTSKATMTDMFKNCGTSSVTYK